MKLDAKSMVIGFLLCFSIVASTAAVSAYQKFGPVQIKALVKVIVAEFNRNRDWHGRPNITADQVRDELKTECENLETNMVNDPDLKWLTEYR